MHLGADAADWDMCGSRPYFRKAGVCGCGSYMCKVLE